jgi:predicted RecB family nuclease
MMDTGLSAGRREEHAANRIAGVRSICEMCDRCSTSLVASHDVSLFLGVLNAPAV